MTYTVIDCATGLMFGPYETCEQAHSRAEALSVWEIINSRGELVDWSRADA